MTAARFRHLAGALVLSACAALSAQTPPASTPWHYHLAAGDHLVYSETVERHIAGGAAETRTKSTFISHVVVLPDASGKVSVGFERIRQSAELVSYRENGKDRLAAEAPKFQADVARIPAVFSEANEFDLSGQAMQPRQAVRESRSRYLLVVHEIEALPTQPISPGLQWTGPAPMHAKFRFEHFEQVGGEQCALVKGAVESTFQLSYWFCPDSGIIRKIDYHGQYATFRGNLEEHVTFELQRRTNEHWQGWLSDSTTSQAALRALLATPSTTIDEPSLAKALRSSDTVTQALALALIYRRKLHLPDMSLVQQLARSSNPEVSRIANRIVTSGTVAPQGATKVSRSAFPPGTFLRYMTSPGYEGYPYIVHIPVDYRGDEPLPVIIHLSGGPGIAMDAANVSESAIAPTKYIVVYPHAAGKMWWDPSVTAMVDHLLQELPSVLNIQPDATYISGFSNGATGAVLYASKWPKRFSALVSLMGAAGCMSDFNLDYDKLAAMPVLLVHGTKDDIIPVSCTEDLYKQLRKHARGQQDILLHILKDRGHDITLASDDGLTLSFIDKLSSK
jgi:pimeloyl-ACP methyl ester carboxylesterase